MMKTVMILLVVFLYSHLVQYTAAQEKKIDVLSISEVEALTKKLKKIHAGVNHLESRDAFGSLDQGRKGAKILRSYEPEDIWTLVDVKFLPANPVNAAEDSRQKLKNGKIKQTLIRNLTATKNGFNSKLTNIRRHSTKADLTTTDEMNLEFTPPPPVIKPGVVYNMSARVKLTKSSSDMKRHGVSAPREKLLNFFYAAGRELNVREGSNTQIGISVVPLRHENGDYRNEGKGVTKVISKSKTELITEHRMRFKIPKKYPPKIIRIGVCDYYRKDRRVEYIYEYQGKPPAGLHAHALDGNPLYYQNDQPENLKPTALIASNVKREGTIADGVSSLIIKAELPNSRAVEFHLKSATDGTLTPLLGGKTITLADKHYAFSLYTPPAIFSSDRSAPKALFDPEYAPKKRLKNILEYRDVNISIGAKNSLSKDTLTLKLARPPVVLIHGLASNAHDCWVVTKPNGTSMVSLLERAGLLPFTVNYQQSNGLPGNGAGSSFKANATSLWDRADPYTLVLPTNKSWYTNRDIEPILSLYQKKQPNRMGGIKQALKYYREELNLAATQADVIGHSMGGILARCYASEKYNPHYKRAENYNQGDINRLITLNSPHHGSELPHLYHALTKAYVASETWFSTFTRLGAVTYASVYVGKPTPAVRDLTAPLNESEQKASALAKIGPTRIPSFAIATTVDTNQLSSTEFDHTLKYRQLYGTASMTFFYNRPLLDAFLRLRFQQWQEAPEPIRMGAIQATGTVITPDKPTTVDAYLHTIHTSIDHNAIYWARQRDATYREGLIKHLEQALIVPFGHIDNDRTAKISRKSFNLFDMLDESKEKLVIGGSIKKLKEPHSNQDVPVSTIGLIRSLIYHNDPNNDGAVRVVSQLGSLPKKSTKVIGGQEQENGIIHSYSPWHYRVQREVITLLKWENDRFEQSGFRAAGELTERYLPSSNLAKARTEGEKAIRWSGIVSSHARAYAAVADEYKTVILVRPVNRDSTPLIRDGNATKAMAIKGKSSNWGPQKGFIPVEQRFSKLWKVHQENPALRKTQVTKYDAITQKVLQLDDPSNPGRKYVKKANLSKGGIPVLCLPAKVESDAERAILYIDKGFYHNWITKKKVLLQPKEIKAIKPLQVLAVDNDMKKPLYVTADYDLLAIGKYDARLVDDAKNFKDQPPEEVANSKPDPVMGAVSTSQKELIHALNVKVKATGYHGGKVTHHGPEVQYSDSPYVDYPILVCDPGEPNVKNDQSIFIIHQGPPGFRDIHLKRYFATQIKKGYYLWSNPHSKGWLWNAHRDFTIATGYDPTDAINLLPYVKEQTDPDRAIEKNYKPQPSNAEMTFKQLQVKAKKGDTKAQIKLAYNYLHGIQTKRDEKKFRSLAKAAMDAGDNDGTLLYVEALLAGFGGPADHKKAANLLSKAWMIDKNHPQGLYLAASMYLEGYGYKKNVKVGMKFLKRSAELNYSPAFYYYGLRIRESQPKKAMEYFEKAAAMGIHQAHYELAIDAESGKIGKKDLKKAIRHYKKAAEISSYHHVVYYIGQIYLEGGNNVAKNETLAIENFMAGSRRQDWSCRMQMAKCYASGIGVEKDQVVAQAWYQFAIYAGVPKDTASINQHLKSLTPAQAKAAKRLCAIWKLNHP